jgi:hypothetical protein
MGRGGLRDVDSAREDAEHASVSEDGRADEAPARARSLVGVVVARLMWAVAFGTGEEESRAQAGEAATR